MDRASKVASDITVYSKYAKHLKDENRRENWNEIVDRCVEMYVKRFPKEESTINKAFEFVRGKRVLPSMRSLQFGGKAITRSNSRIYNCGYLSASSPKFFSELMFLLLGGSGIGYSVQSRHISQLPSVTKPKKAHKFVVQDSIIGWADSIKVLFNAYLKGGYLPEFDYSDIRPKGSLLKTAGGKAPGAGPLRVCHARLQAILEAKEPLSSLTSTEVSDCACIIADAVLAGGIRRSAMICLFDMFDTAMLSYKSGAWYELHPERARVNVSAVAFREDVLETQEIHGIPVIDIKIARKTTEEAFKRFWAYVEASGSGEPGIYWSNHPDWGTNPCCEIALKDMQFCNLCTIDFSKVTSQTDFLDCVWAATVIGTLQASYTDFHYLRPQWKENCQEEALLGVSLTGIADKGDYRSFDFVAASAYAKTVNTVMAERLGINPAARITCVKPEGTASLVLGTSSGVHGRHSPYYIRRMRFNRNEPIAEYLATLHPEIVVDDVTNPNGVIVELPQASPKGSIFRDEPPGQLLDRVKFLSCAWVQHGHTTGLNKHNVSCTVSVRPGQWQEVGKWMWDNREYYNGISVLPYDGGTYQQTPFEECTKKEYERRLALINEVDLSFIRENEDGTNHTEIVACAGNACEA